jgi:hypothetical protein
MPKVAAPVLRPDYFAAAMELLLSSNALVDELYTLDRDGAFDPMKKPGPAGLTFASDRLAVGASVLRDLWWSAWRNSGEPLPRRRD